MANDSRGVRWWLRLLLDQGSKKRVQKETQDALEQGTDPKKAKRNLKEVEGAFDRLIGIAKKVAVALGAAFVLKRIRDYIAEAATLAARYETLGVVLRRVGENAGYSGRQLDDATKALQRAGISMIESRQSAARLIGANIDLAHSTDLARIAQNAAVIANTNSSEAFNRLIHGIASGQVEILRTLGLNVNFQRSYQKLAAQLGKNVASLSETEKAQARTNAVIETGVVIAGSYEAAMGTANKQLGSTARLAENLQIKFGTIILPAYTKGVTHYSDALKDLNTWLDNLTEQDVQSWARDTAAAVDHMATAIRNIVSGVTSVIRTFRAANELNLRFTARFGLTRRDRESARDELMRRRGDIEKLEEDLDRALGRGRFAEDGDDRRTPPPEGPPEPEKAKTLQEELALLQKARDLNLLRGEDIDRVLQIERELLRAMQDGNRSLEDRVRLTQDLATAQDISAGMIGQARAPQVALVDSGMAGVVRGLREAGAREKASEEMELLAEEFRDRFADIEAAGMGAAFGFAGAWQDAFALIRQEGATVGAFMETLLRGMAAAGVGGLAEFASAKIAENVGLFFDNTAKAQAAAASVLIGNPLGAAAAAMYGAAAKGNLVSIAKWGLLAGGAGAAQGAIGGGGRGGLSGGVPTGARDIGGRLADQAGGPETHIHLHGEYFTADNPNVVEVVHFAGEAAKQTFGNNVRVHHERRRG